MDFARLIAATFLLAALALPDSLGWFGFRRYDDSPKAEWSLHFPGSLARHSTLSRRTALVE